jgi:general stress protein 26
MNPTVPNSELVSRAKEVLTSQKYINLATVSAEGLPWNSPIYFVMDKKLTLYWSSWLGAQHSKNLQTNSHVFITLYDSTRLRGTNSLRGLYMQAGAFELNEPNEIMEVSKLLYEEGEVSGPEVFLSDSVKRLYKATPYRIWLNDKSEKEVTPETVKMRVEVPLEELRSAL